MVKKNCFQSFSSERQPKQPEDICTVTVPHAENQTLSDLTCEYNPLLFVQFSFHMFPFVQRVTCLLCAIPFVCADMHMCMCAFSTADGWWRGGILQPGWWSHTVHWLDPVGGVLPAKPWRVALQAQTPLCPDHPVNKGSKRPPRAYMHLNSGAFLDKHSQCSCALTKKDIYRLSEQPC